VPTGNYMLDKGYNAAAAIAKFTAVKFSAAETVTPVTAIGDNVVGVEQFGVSAAEILKGKGASVRRQGRTEMEAAEAMAIGDQVAVNNAGKAVKASSGASGSRIIGMCDEGCAINERCSIMLDLPGTLKP
jgi:hypothetical protein